MPLSKSRALVKKLKIKDVEIRCFDIALSKPFTIAIGTMTIAQDVLIHIRTDAGITGIGEACPFPPITGETQATNIAIARDLREMILGKDPCAIEAIVTGASPMLHSNPSIVAAFDMALYDILGKAAGLPLYQLLGGENRAIETDCTVDLDTPENMARRAKKALALGFKSIKVKVGQDPGLDVQRVQTIRQAIGTHPAVRIDANQGWSVPQAIAALKEMAEFRVQFVEQPVVAWDITGMRTVRRQSPIPVMADEALFSPHDALELVKNEACDYFNIKLMKTGGIHKARQIAHIAAAANIPCMIGSMIESRLALTAAAHFAAAQANIAFADLDANLPHAFDPVSSGMEIKDGLIILPNTPGLGADIDPTFLKKLLKI